MGKQISYHPFIILVFHLLVCLLPISALSDLEVLFKLKASLRSPNGGTGLEDWEQTSSSIDAHCRFSGVTCNDEFRVVKLNVSFVPLFGTIPPEIGMLDQLDALTLAGDNLTGSIPASFANLTSLKFLNMSNNNISDTLHGPIFAGMADLQVIDLYNNNLSGPLPVDVVRLKKLRHLNFGGNYFSGQIPDGYSDIHSLEYLRLSENYLTGRIPVSLSGLPRLKHLYIGYSNTYEGGIPEEFGDLTELIRLDLASCNLTGTIPTSLGKLKKLDSLFLQNNNLTGIIPSEIGEMKSLMSLDLAYNSFTGEIPDSFHKLHSLTLLNLFHNNLHGEIPVFIGELPNLEALQVWGNNFSYFLPESLGRSGRLKFLDVSNNRFTGMIPRDLCKGGRLEQMFLMDNGFFGPIPDELGACKTLKRIRIGGNFFNGTIPAGLFNMPVAEVIEFNDNYLSGELPVEMSGEKLGSLDVSNNFITGVIPLAIGNLPALGKLFFQHNRFTGQIPSQLFTLPLLSDINLSGNNLTGEIPASIGSCKSVISVDFSQNQMSGPIPSTIANMSVLSVLNLSSNNLIGRIPKEIAGIRSLTVLDLSNNDFCGRLPSGGQFSIFHATSFQGNPNLCPPTWKHCGGCPSPGNSASWRSGSKVIILIIAFVTLILISILTQVIRRRRNLERSRTWKLTPFQRLDFKAEDVLDCISEENVIGKGGAGIVYRGAMPDGKDIAIKRLMSRGGLHHDQGFSAEIRTLGRIRHRHIVRLLGYVSNKETNLLLYEYMPNGSLGEMLHGPKGGYLQWDARYKIAVEAAKGLCYLHHDCAPLILHRDVKSNNILLDSDNEAHVADFGLAKFLMDSDASECMSSIAGSYGYIAPEYAYTLKVDEKSDVYSFGVVLLELITGRRPVGEFGDGVDIVRWVQKTMSEIYHRSDAAYVLAIVDSRLNEYALSRVINMFKIAMMCVEDESCDRPTMREVVHMLTNPPKCLETDEKLLNQ